MQNMESKPARTGLFTWLGENIGRILVSLIVPVATFVSCGRDTSSCVTPMHPNCNRSGRHSRGVGGWLCCFLSPTAGGKTSRSWVHKIQPYVFVGPGLALLLWFLALPTLRTLWLSFFDESSTKFIGLDNYAFAFTDRIMLEAFRNNLLWMVVGTSVCVSLGLLIAVLADRSKYESVYKAIIFLPMAISFVGSGVIWKFVYSYKGEGSGIQEIGLLNAIVVALGGQSQAWLLTHPWNNFLLIVIMVWMQTGYAMCCCHRPSKEFRPSYWKPPGDGATEVQAFFKITVPYIQGTLITVSTTF